MTTAQDKLDKILMNGPRHYREAERLLNGDPEDVAAAQVHATLALAAATLGGTIARSPQEFEAWHEVAR